MKTLNISWLGACPKCDNETHTVETENGSVVRLYEGDKITCNKCGNTGEVDVDDCAFAVWDEQEKAL
ncbi:hypothetical protein I5L45_22985 [Serratia marcescens]|nr:hypothetical protein [Serratia marcescens]HEJ8029381.1 hypothetical protein [Serratia marcescens]HEJ8033623.1 hypothetical protein [Serratia marcescens]